LPEMSRPIPARRHCAARCCRRIDLKPSRRAAWIVCGWLCAVVGTLLAAVDLPLPVRIAICVCIATAGWVSLQSVFLLRGPKSVRALLWNDKGQIHALPGSGETEYPVTVRAESFRLGRQGLLLWLDTVESTRVVFIDSKSQEIRAFRRLCRLLNGRPGRFPDEPLANDEGPS